MDEKDDKLVKHDDENCTNDEMYENMGGNDENKVDEKDLDEEDVVKDAIAIKVDELKCETRTSKTPKSAQKRPEIWDIYKKLGTKSGDNEVLIDENETVKNQESPDNAINRPKVWDIYKKLGIRNGDIENQNGDVDATVKKVISSKNAQGCPKNWDIYKKLGMNSEEKTPIEKIQKGT